jgi:hypothetical protein
MLPGQALDLREIHHHAIVRPPFLVDHIPLQCDFKHIAVAVKVAALALVIGNAMSSIELQAAGN